MTLKNVKKLEIEIQSKCNRKCLWCPNHSIDRFTEAFQMPEETYLKVLNDLKDNNFAENYNWGIVSYSRYNEPMLNIDLLKKRVNQAREILPTARLVSNTNGDYITAQNLDGLNLHDLSIMDYDCHGEEYWVKKLKDAGVKIRSRDDRNIIGKHHSIDNILVMLDWPLNNELEDRGGYLKDDIYFKGQMVKWKKDKIIRTKPCLEPTVFLALDYNGNLMPCCHYRSDIPMHKDMILGNVNDTPINEIYHSKKATEFRELMERGDHENYPETCRNCHKAAGRYTRVNPSIMPNTK